MAGDPSLDELPRDGKEILGLLKSMVGYVGIL